MAISFDETCFVSSCVVRRVAALNFIFPALTTPLSAQAFLGYDVLDTIASSYLKVPNGAKTRSPFCFEKFGLTVIRMTINGKEYPYKNALELVYNDGSKDFHGYRRLLENTSAYQKGEPSMILPDMWGHLTYKLNTNIINPQGNMTLFAFNFTPDGLPDASSFHPPQSGNVRLQFRLNASPGHAVTVLIYAEFENVMEINDNNGVLYNDDS